MEGEQTVAGAYEKIAGHEALCAERYKNIHVALREVRGWVIAMVGASLGTLLAICGWALVQLYMAQHTPPAPPTVIVQPQIRG